MKQKQRYLWLICWISAMGGLLFGYDWVVIGGAKIFYEPFFQLEGSAQLRGWAMSSALVGCLAGAVLSGRWSDRYGRKKMLVIASFLFSLSAYGTSVVDTFTPFILYRIIGGMGIGIASNISPVYWSPVHFPSQAGTMGILLDPKHEAFACFPTDFHTDYLTKQSKVICTDGFYKDITPLVECVDNFVNNRRLSSLFEACCGKGRLLFCSMDLTNDMETHPEKCQLLYSLLRYMNSDAFRPACTIRWDDLYNSVHINQEEKI